MNVAVIGTSAIAHKLVKVFKSCEDICVYALYSRKETTGKAFANAHGIEHVFTNLDEMLENQCIDIVYIASPNALHYEQVKLSLMAKKHVICEKPITLSTHELKNLCDLAKEKNCFLFEAISTLHMPNYQSITQRIKHMEGIHLVRVDLSQYSKRYEQLLKGEHVNVFDPELGGGALHDLGVYCLHFVLGLFGQPHEIYSKHILYQNTIDTSGVIVLHYPQMNAILSYGKDSHGRANACIQSEQGTIEIEGPCSRIKKVYWNHGGIKEDISLPTDDQHHMYEIKEFIRIIKFHDIQEEYRLWRNSMLVCQCMDVIRNQRGTI